MKKIYKGYQEIAPRVWLKKESVELLSRVDSLVLDIDGVILDVFSSFRKAISLTVQYYFAEFLRLKGKETLIRPQETELFKLAGGFNNDFELTSGVVLFYLKKAERLKDKNLSLLRKLPLSIEKFTSLLREKGGGLKAASHLTEKKLKTQEKKLIKQIFQEYYGGEDCCLKLYGFNPRFVKRRGLLNKEEVILDKKLLRSFLPKVAVLTGRTKEETEVALAKASLTGLFSKNQVLTDEEVKKPDPYALEILGKHLQSKVGIYLGDTPDDLRTVNNFKKLKKDKTFLSGIVLKKTSNPKIFFQERADILAESTNNLLKTLINLKGRENGRTRSQVKKGN